MMNRPDNILDTIPSSLLAPHEVYVFLQENMAQTSRLGFPGSAKIAVGEKSSIAWDDEGNMITAIGAPSALIQALTPGASAIGKTPGTPELAAPPEPVVAATEDISVLPPAAQLPLEGDVPFVYLSRLTDITQLRAWVLSEGVNGPHSLFWAHLAQACEWTLPTREVEPAASSSDSVPA